VPIAAVLIGIFAACGSAGSRVARTAEPPAAPASAPAVASVPAPQATRRAASFSLVAYQDQATLGGDQLDFSRLLGQGKPVVLNFWAGLCPPCRQEMPGFQRAYDALNGAVTLVGVDFGPFTGLGSHDDARRLLQQLNIRYPAGYALTAEVLRAFDARSMPTTVLFDAHGRVATRHAGYYAEDQLRADIQRLLAAAGQ